MEPRPGKAARPAPQAPAGSRPPPRRARRPATATQRGALPFIVLALLLDVAVVGAADAVDAPGLPPYGQVLVVVATCLVVLLAVGSGWAWGLAVVVTAWTAYGAATTPYGDHRQTAVAAVFLTLHSALLLAPAVRRHAGVHVRRAWT